MRNCCGIAVQQNRSDSHVELFHQTFLRCVVRERSVHQRTVAYNGNVSIVALDPGSSKADSDNRASYAAIRYYVIQSEGIVIEEQDGRQNIG